MYQTLIHMPNLSMRMDVMDPVVKSDVPVLLVHWDLVVAKELMAVKVHRVSVVCLVSKVNLEILKLLINQLENLALQVERGLSVPLVPQDKLADQDSLANLVKGVFPESRDSKVNPDVPDQLVHEEIAVNLENLAHVVHKGKLVHLVLVLKMSTILMVNC